MGTEDGRVVKWGVEILEGGRLDPFGEGFTRNDVLCLSKTLLATPVSVVVKRRDDHSDQQNLYCCHYEILSCISCLYNLNMVCNLYRMQWRKNGS